MGNNLHRRATRARAVLEVLATMLIILTSSVALYLLVSGEISRRAAAEASRSATPAPPTPPPVSPPLPIPADPIPLATAATKGAANAPVAIIEFSDFQCPFCARFALDTLPRIEEEYITPGLVRFAYWHLPLETIHPRALRSAEATECAGQQGQFWNMHDLLFQDIKDVDEASLYRRAAALKLDESVFRACLTADTDDKVRRDMVTARTFGVSGTPTFFIGRVQPDGRLKVARRVSGAQPFEVFKQILDALLAEPAGSPLPAARDAQGR